MAACWKGSWNVEPLALSVPERLGLSPPEPPVLLLDDELQAARDKAVTTRASAVVVMCRTRRRCMSD
jgi:hypothetical protein